MNMMEMLRKSLSFGLGATAYSADMLKKFVDEMVEKGEMTSDEARNFVDDINQKAETEKNRMQEWMKDQMHKMLQQAGGADAQRVERLESRIAALEMRLGRLMNEHMATVPSESGVVGDEIPPESGGDVGTPGGSI